MSFSAAHLRAVLEEQLPKAASGLAVAVSGGGDSACLAAALGELIPPVRRLPLRALHVDHGLQPLSGSFEAASAALCRSLDIPLTALRAPVKTPAGVSIEAAARDARYLALARALAPGECLLTAHHAEDQAETLLLQLMRGAGLKGLSAMPAVKRLGRGWHLRPLLEVARRELRAFGAARGLASLEDPMNEDLRFDRSYLRACVWPQLEARWPGAAAALSRTARHLAGAQQLLDHSAALQLERLRDGAALSVAELRRLGELEQGSVVRHWLAGAAIAPPSTERLKEALRQTLGAAGDRVPATRFGEHALRRYRGRLFVTDAAPPALGEPRAWPTRLAACVELGEGLGRLRWAQQPGALDAARLPASVCVRRRRGGETLKIGRGGRTQSLQHLCQAWGVLPWMRDALPLVYAGEELIAVGDLWRDARWCRADQALGLACVWEDAPNLI